MSAALQNAVPDDMRGELISAFYRASADEVHEKWRKLIDYQLIEWMRDPSQLEDDEMPPPSRDTIQRAIELAEELRRSEAPAPTRVVPDAHAGIVFERETGNVFESIRISADNTIAYCFFVNSRLKVQEIWPLRTSEGEGLYLTNACPQRD
jgi:hypothetical protein